MAVAVVVAVREDCSNRLHPCRLTPIRLLSGMAVQRVRQAVVCTAREVMVLTRLLLVRLRQVAVAAVVIMEAQMQVELVEMEGPVVEAELTVLPHYGPEVQEQ